MFRGSSTQLYIPAFTQKDFNFTSLSTKHSHKGNLHRGFGAITVTPRSCGYGDVTATCIYAGQKYPHVYTLSISTGKNQSTEARGALYIPTHEYSYKVITRGDKYYKNITSPVWRNCENTRMCTSMNSTKGGSESQQEISRAEQGGLEG